MKEEKRIQKSRILARLLRFDKSYPYKEGRWRLVDDLTMNHGFTLEELEEIVKIDSKNRDGQNGRFEFSEDKDGNLVIRARDGYAAWMPRDEKKPAKSFPDVLYHGTSLDAVQSILEEGINTYHGDRADVHLSDNKTRALRVGSRHKKPSARPVVLCIDTNVVCEKGKNLYAPVSEAWLADEVPQDAISHILYIGLKVAFYETEEQSRAILSICNNRITHNMIVKRFLASGNDIIRPVNYLDKSTVQRIARCITFEEDKKYATITAFIPIPISIDVSGYEQYTEDLGHYVRELQQSFLADAIIDLMPRTQLTDRKRAYFYLELGHWYRNSTSEHLLPIDWSDIRVRWRKSGRFIFQPVIGTESLSYLVQLLAGCFDYPDKCKGVCFVIRLFLPSVDSARVTIIQEIIGKFRSKGGIPLVSISFVSGQRTYSATVCIMDE